MIEETIVISKAEYSELKEDQRWLRALEAAGVDNWEGYFHAQEHMDEDE